MLKDASTRSTPPMPGMLAELNPTKSSACAGVPEELPAASTSVLPGSGSVCAESAGTPSAPAVPAPYDCADATTSAQGPAGVTCRDQPRSAPPSSGSVSASCSVHVQALDVPSKPESP